MTSRLKVFVAAGALLSLSACVIPPQGQAYWQRVEDSSALYMTGPKAQQVLDENIATCVREVDELVELGALRETTPPDTHSEYHRALKASGALDYYDTPTRYGEKIVSHTNFHDFETCMRSKGWERVNYVRYQSARQSQETYTHTQQIRRWGVSGDAAVKKQMEETGVKDDYSAVNK